MKGIICVGGVCSSWGRHYARHLRYVTTRGRKTDECARCGSDMKPIKKKP